MNDSILYPIIKEGKYGFVNMQGELVVSPKYDLVGRFVENRCSVEVFQDDFTKLIGYIDSSGQEVIPLRPAKYSSSFSEGLAQISGDLKKLGYIDKNGKFIIPPHFLIEFEGEKSLGFSEGIAAIATNKGWQYFDKKGGNNVNGYYLIAKRFVDGVALVHPLASIVSENNLTFINTKGQKIETVPCKISFSCHGFRNGLAVVSMNSSPKHDELDRFGFINIYGDEAFSSRYSYASGFHEGVCIVKSSSSNWGVINTSGDYIIDPVFDEIGYFNYGIAPFRKNDLWGLINNNGDIILEPKFSHIQNFIGFLPSKDPFHNGEYRELTVANVKSKNGNSTLIKPVYINRKGDFVCFFDWT